MRAAADIIALVPELWRTDISRELAPWNAFTTELMASVDRCVQFYFGGMK